jgi:hypothetical protein
LPGQSYRSFRSIEDGSSERKRPSPVVSRRVCWIHGAGLVRGSRPATADGSAGQNKRHFAGGCLCARGSFSHPADPCRLPTPCSAALFASRYSLCCGAHGWASRGHPASPVNGKNGPRDPPRREEGLR